MNKNVKSIFLVLAILTLLVSVAGVCAADDIDNTDESISTLQDTSSDVIQKQTTSPSDNNNQDTTNIKKEDKTIKTATNTVPVNDYTGITEAINTAVTDADNDKYEINLNEGTYQITGNVVFNSGDYTPSIILNGNNQSLTASNVRRYVRFNNGCDVTIDNVNINHLLQNYGNNITITNSIINNNITNNLEMNLIIKNSTINTGITNNGNLTIDDNCILGENFNLNGEGTIFTNQSKILLERMESIDETVTYENMTFKNIKTVTGNATLINCTIDVSYTEWGMTFYNMIYNTGCLNLINCVLNCGFNNTGEMIIDNCTIPKSRLYQCGNMIIKNVDWELLGLYGASMNDNFWLYSNTTFNNSKFSSILDSVSIRAEGNVTFDNCEFNINSFGVFDSTMDNSTVSMVNSIVKGDTSLNPMFTVENIRLINSIFEENGKILNASINTYIDNCTFINNSNGIISGNSIIENIYTNNIEMYNSTFKDTILNESLIIIEGNCDIINNTFENITRTCYSPYNLATGLAINLQPTGGNKIININDNIFKNNYINAVEGSTFTQQVWQVGIKTYDFTRSGYGTDISCGVNQDSNNFTDNNNNVIIINNQFINSETTQKAGSIFINFNETFDNNSLTIKNNTFDNVKSKSETIIYNNTQNVDIADNTFINCAIDLDEFTLSSPQDSLTISPETPITLNIQATLTNPEYYDSDLLDKNEYQIFINDENVYNTTENEFTFNSDVYGTLTMYVVNPAINNKTNDITVTVTKKEIVISPINAAVGDKVTLRAEIKVNDELQSDLNSGKVTFKINGKTVKDENGKVVYAKVVNGVAIIEDYEVPQEWAKEDSTIQAVYSGSNQLEKFSSEKTEITIAPTIPTLTTESITSTAGETITLTATITDNNKVINNGKIVFKINGKTVKDENGKVIYAKVVDNSVSVDYVIPDSYKTADYTITAVYISNDYDRLEDSKTLTII